MVQPALSASIQRLETELGVKLFNRTGRTICLNEYGETMLKRVEPILAAIDSLPEELCFKKKAINIYLQSASR